MVVEIIFLAALVAVDLVSKEMLAAFLNGMPDKSYVMLDKIFTLRYVENDGASFGIFAGQQRLLIAITVIVCASLLFLLIWKNRTPKFFRYSLLMIVGGAIGNLYDRAALGYVRDFIDYTFLDTFFGIRFGIGNIADIFLCVGVLMILIYIIFDYDESHFKGGLTLKRKRTE